MTADAKPAGPSVFISPVARPVPLRQSVYEALVELVVGGRLGPGEHLVETELARLLGVSRQPVREALHRLEAEGWVDLRPNQGAFVHVPTDHEVDELLDVRELLEVQTARLAARSASRAAVARLLDIWHEGENAVASGDTESIVAANNRFHAELAREVVGEEGLVGGSIGPTGQLVEPYGPLTRKMCEAAYAEQARALVDGGVDVLVLETFFALEEALWAVDGIRSVTELPLIVSFSFDQGTRTMMGLSPADVVAAFQPLGVAAIGANCGRSLEDNDIVVHEFLQATSVRCGSSRMPEFHRCSATPWSTRPTQQRSPPTSPTMRGRVSGSSAAAVAPPPSTSRRSRGRSAGRSSGQGPSIRKSRPPSRRNAFVRTEEEPPI